MNDSDSAIDARADALVEDHENLLRDLVRHRSKHNISQDVVAERMGVTQPTVAAFERYDANPTLATIRRYALAVGVRLHTRVIDDCTAHVESANVTRDINRDTKIEWFLQWGSGPAHHDGEWEPADSLYEELAFVHAGRL